ncbi:MAG: NIPSNAP family protein [Pirellulaceae bacterium]|nr:NIPSNAP family protein [Pirellulaceae bacterium]
MSRWQTSVFTLALAIGSTLLATALATVSNAADPDKRVFEMRVYYAAEGKLAALNSRFRDHTVKLFEKHGITNIGYFEPLENPERKLIYFLAYPSREARDASWKAFMADPDWQKAYKASEVDGKLVAKVDVVYFHATDYSPAIKSGTNGERVFEMRTYTASPGKLENLNARFRDHTVKLFEKHGMTNIAYWTPMADQKGANDTLLYIIAHKSQASAKESFGAFGKDADWVAARKASEEKAGGSLTVQGGVKSVFMKATDYSPIR